MPGNPDPVPLGHCIPSPCYLQSDENTPLPDRRRLEPDVDPAHAHPQSVLVHGDRCSCRLSLTHPRPLLANLAAILRQQDPDLPLTLWGDTRRRSSLHLRKFHA